MHHEINAMINQFKETLKKFTLKEPESHLPFLSEHTLPAFQIGDLTLPLPVVQGGMGVGISLSGLASAVSNQGGIGIIAANGIGLLEKDYYQNSEAASLKALRDEIRKARSKSQGVLGVNIMVALNNYQPLMHCAIDEGIDILFLGAGLPIKDIPLEIIRSKGIKVIPIVSSVRAASLIFRMWQKIYKDVPDGLVFEGPKAGGHLGFSPEEVDLPEFQLESILPGLVESMKPYEKAYQRSIPVIAAGGIFSGEDIHSALELGASAVQMGTRFAATDECDAHQDFKQAIVDCQSKDIGLIKSPVGMPGRAIRNAFIQATEDGIRHSFKCPSQCLSSCKAQEASYCISIALDQARQGKMQRGFVFSGTNGVKVNEILSVKSLIRELQEGYTKALQGSLMVKIRELCTAIQGWRKDYHALNPNSDVDVLQTPLALRNHPLLEKLTMHYERLILQVKKLKKQLTGMTLLS